MALMQRKKIVVPITVGVGSKVRRTAGRSYNTDIRAFAGPRIDHVKGVCTRVDAGNHLFARPFPRRVSVRIADVRDVLMRTLGVRFCDAFDFAICHLPLLLDPTRAFFDDRCC